MRTVLRILSLGRGHLRGFAVVAMLVSLSTAASLIQPWIYRAIVDDVACYRTEAETDDPSGATASLSATGADWVTFTSASTVEHFHARFNLPELLRRFPHLKLATIGPETSQALVALGLTPAVEAKTHTLEGLVAALEGAQTRPRKA